MIRDYKIFDGEKTRHAVLDDYLVYRNRQPEDVAKDFNEYTETGIYSWSSVADILKDCANRPTDEFGTLEVKNDHTGIIYHRYEAIDNVVYLRSHLNDAWTAWEKEVNQKYVDDEIKKVNEKVEGIDVSWEGISGKPSQFPPTQHEHSIDEVKDTSNNKTVRTLLAEQKTYTDTAITNSITNVLNKEV